MCYSSVRWMDLETEHCVLRLRITQVREICVTHRSTDGPVVTVFCLGFANCMRAAATDGSTL